MKRIFLISISLGIVGLLIIIQRNDISPLQPKAEAEDDAFVLQNLNYTYDPAGNILEINDQSDLPTKKKTTYVYDDLNRLLSAQTSGFSQGDYTQTYKYDPIGNMTYKSDVGPMIHGGTGFPNPHAITEVEGKKYTYDKNGNVTSDGEKTYTWNILNQLTSVTFPDGTVMEYTYNPFGQRLTSTNLKTGEKTIYVNKFMEIRPKSTIYYIWAGNQRIAQIEVPKGKTKEEGILTYLHEDHLGGTVVSTDEKGKVVAVYDYDPYGTQILNKSDSTTQVPYSFTGKEYEKNTGLYYFGARYYDPKVGRFMSEDPVAMNQPERLMGDPQLFNSYSYSRNNPINYYDPNGELPKVVWAGAADALDTIGYHISADYLRISVQGRIKDLGGVQHAGEGSEVTNTIRNSTEYKNRLMEVKSSILGGRMGGTPGIKFKSGDLFFSFHKADFNWDAKLIGQKEFTILGKSFTAYNYKISINIGDKYNFEYMEGDDLISTINNLAYEDQKDGKLTNFRIDVKMQENFLWVTPTPNSSSNQTSKTKHR